MSGRIRPTTTVAGMAVNDHAGLESEADTMGSRAQQAGANALQRLVDGEKPDARGDETLQHATPDDEELKNV